MNCLFLKGRRTSILNSREAIKHSSMLQLAVQSEKSCEASIRTASRAVVDLFPRATVLETKWRNAEK